MSRCWTDPVEMWSTADLEAHIHYLTRTDEGAAMAWEWITSARAELKRRSGVAV